MLASLAARSRRLLNRIGFQKAPAHVPLPFWCAAMARRHSAIDRQVRPYTMTSFARIVAMCQSIAHLEARGIAGAVVEFVGLVVVSILDQKFERCGATLAGSEGVAKNFRRELPAVYCDQFHAGSDSGDRRRQNSW